MAETQELTSAIQAPDALKRALKLGKHAPEFDKRTLLFGKYLKPALPSPPATVDYSRAVPIWPMFGNDTYGDCTCAAAGHMIQEWTANAGTERTPSDQQVLAMYDHFSHGHPDAGASMLAVLKYWRSIGLGEDKIGAFAAIEPQNTTQAMDSVFLFGTCYLGLALPNFAVAGSNLLATPWLVPPGGPKGDAAPNPQNGHCVPAIGYDQRNLYVVTWGALKPMSWQFYTTYTDEAYAVLSADWFNGSTGASPPGFDLAALKADLAAL